MSATFIPPPQVLEQDIAQTGTHLDLSRRNGKGKQRSRHTDSSESSSPETSSEALDKIEYPPANEESEETRRVEENLRRWEVAERQRRKAARGSSQSTNSSSLLDDVTRRASLLWSNKSPKHPSIGGSHAALQSQETVDALPLQQLELPVSPSPSPSPTRSESGVAHVNDPFANPPELLSPFSDSYRADATGLPSNTLHGESLHNIHSSNKSIQSPKGIRHPLPKPLNLPQPLTPPRAISPIPSLNLTSEERDHTEGKPVRWWHEWLCGCGEGPDRGGEFQAGRTNPFE